MSGPSTESRLPEFVDPYHLARNGEQLAGKLPIGAMKRLLPLLQGEPGSAEVELDFELEDGRVPVIHGRVSTALQLLCQRCLEPVTTTVEASFVLAVVRNEAQMARLSEHYEPLLLEEGNLSISDLVEDELLLSLPLVAMHDPQQCAVKLTEVEAAEPEPEPEMKKNPFAVLASLKKQ